MEKDTRRDQTIQVLRRIFEHSEDGILHSKTYQEFLEESYADLFLTIVDRAAKGVAL